jgi:hypothetical protein
MTDKDSTEHLNPWSPATYLLEVEGLLGNNWSDRFAGMRISSHKREDLSVITQLTGPVVDQSELMGVLNGLAELHLPIRRVQLMEEEGSPQTSA